MWSEIWSFIRAELVELVGSFVLLVALPFAVNWLRQRAGATFADRVDAILKHAIQAALNKVVGTQPYAPVPAEKVEEVVETAAEIAMAGAPAITKKIENTLRDKVLARIIVEPAPK